MKPPVRAAAFPDPEQLAEDAARAAIRIVIDWSRDGSPDWAPLRGRLTQMLAEAEATIAEFRPVLERVLAMTPAAAPE